MTTAAATIQQMGYRSGKIYYIANSYLTLNSTTTFTAAFWFASVADSANTFLGWGVWRPTAASAADYFRHISSVNVTTGVVTVDVAWSDSTLGTEDFYLLAPGITPIHIINALNLSLDKAHFVSTDALSTKPNAAVIADASFQSSATSSYVASGATFTKVTTDNSENVYPDFIGSGRIQAASGGDYIKQTFSVIENSLVNAYALTRLDSGTAAQLILYDATGSAAIGTTVSHGQEAWQWLVRRGETVPEDCELLEARIAGEAASDDIYANALCVYFPSQSRVILDTKWDSNFKAMKLLYWEFGNATASNVYEALASQVKEVPKEDYKFVFSRAAANQGYVQFRNERQRHWMQYPLFVFGRRPWSALTTIAISDLTTACDIDIDLWEALACEELFTMGDVMRKVTDATTEIAKARERRTGVEGQSAYDSQSPAPAHYFSRWGTGV